MRKQRIGIFFLCVCAGLISLFLFTPFIYAKTHSKTSLSHYIMGLLHERFDEQDQALEEYQQAEEFDYYSGQIHLKLGAEYLKKQDFSKALHHLELAVKLDPENLQSHFILAVLYSALGRQDDSTFQYEHILKEASKKDPQNLNLYHNLAELYFRQNKLDEAILKYEYILSVDPKDKIAYFYLGNILYVQEKKDLAVEKLKKAIEVDPSYADALNSLGYIYADEGMNLDEAMDLIKKALELDPENGAYIDSLGWVYWRKGLSTQALEQLEKAIAIFPDPEIYDHLGEVYYKLKMFKEAQESWESSLKLGPLRKGVKEKLEKLQKEMGE